MLKKLKKERPILFLLIIFIALSTIFILAIDDFNQRKEWADQQDEIVTLSPRASYLTTTKRLKLKAVEPVERMIMDAEKEGLCLIVMSGFRTSEQQQRLYNFDREGLVAIPGTSEHEEGIAVDFGGCPMLNGVRDDRGERLELRDDFPTLPEYQWLKENAYKYNFIQSYTAENSEETGFPAEEWHWRYTK